MTWFPYKGRAWKSGPVQRARANVITRYVEADKRRDVDAIVALFTADAVVVDEGQTWRGTGAIRTWQDGPASTHQYTTAVSSTERTSRDDYLVTGRLPANGTGGRDDPDGTRRKEVPERLTGVHRMIDDEIWREADGIADERHCFTEGDTIALEDPDRHW
jgi:ketosteroid isomerase-like protein